MRLCVQNVVASFLTNKTVSIISRENIKSSATLWISTYRTDWSSSLAVLSQELRYHLLPEVYLLILQKRAR